MQEQNQDYAGFWIRTAATIIDTIFVMLITFPLFIAIYGWNYFNTQSDIFAGPFDFILSWVFPAVAAILFWLKKQATPGKMVVSIKVVDATTGQTMSVGQSVGRYFAYFLSAFPLGLGFIWVAFDSKKQGWHDKLANTVVLNVKNSNSTPSKVK